MTALRQPAVGQADCDCEATVAGAANMVDLAASWLALTRRDQQPLGRRSGKHCSGGEGRRAWPWPRVLLKDAPLLDSSTKPFSGWIAAP